MPCKSYVNVTALSFYGTFWWPTHPIPPTETEHPAAPEHFYMCVYIYIHPAAATYLCAYIWRSYPGSAPTFRRCKWECKLAFVKYGIFMSLGRCIVRVHIIPIFDHTFRMLLQIIYKIDKFVSYFAYPVNRKCDMDIFSRERTFSWLYYHRFDFVW